MFCNLMAQLITSANWILKPKQGVPSVIALGICARKKVLGHDFSLFTRRFEERKNWLRWMSKWPIHFQLKEMSSGNLFLKKLDG